MKTAMKQEVPVTFPSISEKELMPTTLEKIAALDAQYHYNSGILDALRCLPDNEVLLREKILNLYKQ